MAIAAPDIEGGELVMTTLVNALRNAAGIPARQAECPPSWSFTVSELVGRYFSGADALEIAVVADRSKLELRIRNPATAGRAAHPFALDVDGDIVQEAGGPYTTFPARFFRDPGSGCPCLYYEWRAYKKVVGRLEVPDVVPG
jgi:hypothetical protein